MKKVLVVGNGSEAHDNEPYYQKYADFFSQGIITQGSQATVAYALFDDLYIAVGDDSFDIYDTRNNCALDAYDVILLRGVAFRSYFDVIKAVSTYAALHGIPSINDYRHFRDSSKLMQAVQFFEHGLPVAKTVYVTDAVLAGKHKLPFDFPCVLKATFGAHGNDNHLVRSLEEAVTIVDRSGGKRFVLQRFVANDRDYRVLVIGSEVAVIERMAGNGSHLNNTSQGGRARLVATETLPTRVIDGCHKIVKALDMTIAGVDVLLDKTDGSSYFLEVNSQPQLMTGALTELKSEMVGRLMHELLRDI